MKLNIITSVVLSSLFFSSSATAVDFFDPIDGQFDVGEYLAENAYGFLPVPSIITEPSLGTGLMVMGLFLHEDEEQSLQRQKVARESTDGGANLLTPGISVIGLGATDNKTKFAFAGHRHTWKQDGIRYLVGGAYGDINMNYYSQLNLGLDLALDLNMEGYGVLQTVQFRIADSPVFLGLSQKYLSLDLSANNDLSFIPPELSDRLLGLFNLSPTVSSLGAILEYDSLDNFFMPSKGYDYTLTYDWYDKAFGGDYNYQSLSATGINYWPILDNLSFGLKLSYQSVESSSSIPIFSYPYIDLRGIPSNRYQGENVSTAEIELLWKVTPRWMLLGFTGSGLAGSSASEMWDADNQNSYGAGFRYTIARRYGLYMGIDVAKGPEDTAWYVNIGTGF
ncbi:outer membrane protein assembly factor [Shewanella olleyana]|uniref:BamA/TamA family outer membrane protein n=1 Tax=Shewanella olleyana TaxID=135626 RepID=UPI0020100435|nr:BamA/TamA family outer membrane protein [Shewanella olleyana]MCL1066090.1 outer membrane protein assembly factor [Shewanella olleyana]